MKKTLSLLLTAIICLGLVMSASAAGRADKESITIALQGELTTLDAQYPDDGNMRPITQNIYDTLYVLEKETLEPKPWLATGMNLVDSLTWEFKLREGVKFHDGSPLTVEDVVFSINRNISPELNSQFLNSVDAIDHAEAVDANTFRIVTKEPDPLLLKRLTLIPILSKAFTEAHTANELTLVANGTGPYKFVEWKSGSHVKITANENYWGEAPAIKNATYRFIEEKLTALSALQAGEVDLAVNILPEYVENTPKVFTNTSFETYWVRFNQIPENNSVFKNKDLRLAANYAIDFNTIAEALFLGYATPCQGQMGRDGYVGYNPNIIEYPYDVEKAKELMKAAGYNGEEIEFVSQRGRWLKDGELTEAIASYLLEAGFNVKTKILSWSEWLNVLFDKTKAPDIILSSNSNDFFDMDRPFSACVLSTSSQSAMNNPEYDAAILAARQELDTAKRQAMYEDLAAKFHEDPFALYTLSINDLHGGAADLNWTPRRDTRLYLIEMSFSD